MPTLLACMCNVCVQITLLCAFISKLPKHLQIETNEPQLRVVIWNMCLTQQEHYKLKT